METLRRISIVAGAVGIVMAIAAAPRSAYASHGDGSDTEPPISATRSEVLGAVRDGALFLDEYAVDWSEHETSNSVVTVYEVNDPLVDPVLWDWAWCTTTSWRLRDNWKNITLSFKVDGHTVPLGRFRTWDFDSEFDVPGHGLQSLKCRMSYGALYDWPDGDHDLTVEAKINKTINDGLDIYPVGTTFLDVYQVTVTQKGLPLSRSKQPVGVQYLGDVDYVCYFIEGINDHQLAEQMNKLGPESEPGDTDVWAAASGEYDMSGEVYAGNGFYDMSSVRVTWDPLVTIPCWVAPAGVSSYEVSKFDDLMELIAGHELRHVEIEEYYAGILQARLRAAQKLDIDTAEDILYQVYLEVDAAHDEFHASPAGQPVAYG